MVRFGRARRPVIGGLVPLFCIAVLVLGLAGCDDKQPWHETDITGAMPPLSFTMVRAGDGKTVTADDYRGKVVLLYFGYTYCPDVCPATLTNIAQILRGLGDKAKDVKVLFVTVDPNRDGLALLRQYTPVFAPQVDGLRGDPAQLAALAKRYRVAYSVRPASPGHEYEVSHGSAVYVFDRDGRIRLLLSSLASGKPEINGATADLNRLVAGAASGGGLLDRLLNLF